MGCEARAYLTEQGDDSVPVLAHFLRLGSLIPDLPGFAVPDTREDVDDPAAGVAVQAVGMDALPG